MDKQLKESRKLAAQVRKRDRDLAAADSLLRRLRLEYDGKTTYAKCVCPKCGREMGINYRPDAIILICSHRGCIDVRG